MAQGLHFNKDMSICEENEMKKILMTLLFLVIIAVSTSVFVHVSLVLITRFTPYSQITSIDSSEDDEADKQEVENVAEPKKTGEENNSIERKHINDCSYICPLNNRVKVIEFTN